jgi:hypothetical protein
MSLPDVLEPEVGSLEPAEALEVLGALPTSPLPFVGINPCRIADTRSGQGFSLQAGPPTLPGFTTRVFQIAGTVAGVPTQCGIPLTAQAVSFQFTVTGIAANGNLIAWPEGTPPTTSVLNWNANSVAIGNGTVVALSATGALSVRINGPGADLIIDVNGYYGDNFDSLYVNEGQASSITSAMITDGAIVNADINASAAIADTKLATIATAGKVADTALSANVTKLGQTIEAAEIADLTRSIHIPLMSLTECQNNGFLDFNSGTDPISDYVGDATDGIAPEIEFDATPGSPDQDSEICGELMIPADYASGGNFRIRARATGPGGVAVESLNCDGVFDGGALAAGSVAINGPQTYVCTPTFPTMTPGGILLFTFWVSADAAMDNAIRIQALSFEYTAVQ